MYTQAMSTPRRPDVVSSKPTNNSVGQDRNINAPADDENADGGNISTINDLESLKKGIIKTKAPSYTILLLGEAGVGKTSVLEYIANVLLGNDIDHFNFDVLDPTNEQGGSGYHCQTNSAYMYEFTSKNGTMVRFLDTPGFIDTCDIQQDELHRKSIATQIQKHLDSVTAVLVLANGTVPRGTSTGGLHHALSTLSTILPNTLADKIAFMFTNVASPLSWNFCYDTLPGGLKDVREFRIDNPVALQKNYLKLKDDPKRKKRKAQMREEVKASEHEALEMLVDFFDWLGGLERQTTTDLVKKSQNIQATVTNYLAPMDHAAIKRVQNPNYITGIRRPNSIRNKDLGASRRK